MEEKSSAEFKLGPVSVKSDKKKDIWWIIPLGIVLVAAVFFAVGLVFPLLWKATMTDIFGVKEITFWQAWAIIIMAQLLFKANINVQKHLKKENR